VEGVEKREGKEKNIGLRHLAFVHKTLKRRFPNGDSLVRVFILPFWLNFFYI